MIGLCWKLRGDVPARICVKDVFERPGLIEWEKCREGSEPCSFTSPMIFKRGQTVAETNKWRYYPLSWQLTRVERLVEWWWRISSAEKLSRPTLTAPPELPVDYFGMIAMLRLAGLQWSALWAPPIIIWGAPSRPKLESMSLHVTFTNIHYLWSVLTSAPWPQREETIQLGDVARQDTMRERLPI